MPLNVYTNNLFATQLPPTSKQRSKEIYAQISECKWHRFREKQQLPQRHYAPRRNLPFDFRLFGLPPRAVIIT